VPATSAAIDFADPRDAHAARLRHRFGPPKRVLVAHGLHEVAPVLLAVQAAAQLGDWCVGYVRYEAAAAFDAAMQTHPATGPLAWFAVYPHALPWPQGTVPLTGESAQVDWHTTPTRAGFDAALERIGQAIARGDLYQVNYTAPLYGHLDGSAADLFAALQRAQPGGYALHLDAGAEQVLSVSPELFFDWQGDSLLTRPMKGTAPRGATPEQDAASAAALRASPKERAENVMIVDLLRNDVSRIAQPHSVAVPALLQVQALPAVWQMTSDVRARTRPGTTLADVFGALFPCGSVTGAPKLQAMHMIRALEPQARGVYCGALGVVRPDGPAGQGGFRATFNVPIRTVVLRGQSASCGIGSGITSDAQPGAEWHEWRHKRSFLERASMPFDVLETLALEGGHCRHQADHFSRMATAAAHFGYPWPEAQAQAALQALARQHPRGLWRVRCLLNAAGDFRAEAFAMQPTPASIDAPVRLQLASKPIPEAHGEFTRHKTTRRAHYDRFQPTDPTVFDTVLWNEAGELTECTRGNVAVRLDGVWVTPPLACGLLPGVGRAVALREGRLSEAVVHTDDLRRVQGWAFLNSLRGWLPATLA
jgi:para-aminobenzoate synthetase/4-amino-4-deoxychorismate lyase